MTDRLIALSKTLYDVRISEMRSLLKEKPKRYLLIAGDDSYNVGRGTYHWVGFFDTEEEAINAIDEDSKWYEIVDLHTWKKYQVVKSTKTGTWE